MNDQSQSSAVKRAGFFIFHADYKDVNVQPAWRRRVWLQCQVSVRQKGQMQNCGFLERLNHVPVWSFPSLSDTRFKESFSAALSIILVGFSWNQNLKILYQLICIYGNKGKESVENGFNTKKAT